MIEMLVTAFILGIGILGLTMLQAMTIRGARGGSSQTVAIEVAEMVMDQIEMEGRLSWLNLTASQLAVPAPMTTLTYIGHVPLAAPLNYTIKGQTPVANAPNPVDSATYYQVTISSADIGAAGNGTITNYTVLVKYSEQTSATTGLPVPRQVQITRSILHG
jgi:Tfp pilus assembly protein PilV